MEKEKNSKIEYINKKLLYSNLDKEIKNFRTFKSIDRMDYEANTQGCIVTDYDKFRKRQQEEVLILLGVLGMYFLIGMFVGIACIISWAYHVVG